MSAIIISDEHIDMLDELAKRYSKSYGQVVEMLIEDRHSVSDQHANAKRRNDSMKAYFYTNDITSEIRLERIWRAGYNRGWIHFQTRHKSDAVVLPVEPEGQEVLDA